MRIVLTQQQYAAHHYQQHPQQQAQQQHQRNYQQQPAHVLHQQHAAASPNRAPQVVPPAHGCCTAALAAPRFAISPAVSPFPPAPQPHQPTVRRLKYQALDRIEVVLAPEVRKEREKLLANTDVLKCLAVDISSHRAKYRDVDLSLEGRIVKSAQDSLLRRAEQEDAAAGAATGAADLSTGSRGGGTQGGLVREESEGFLASVRAIAAMEEAERNQARQSTEQTGVRTCAAGVRLPTLPYAACVRQSSCCLSSHTCVCWVCSQLRLPLGVRQMCWDEARRPPRRRHPAQRARWVLWSPHSIRHSRHRVRRMQRRRCPGEKTPTTFRFTISLPQARIPVCVYLSV